MASGDGIQPSVSLPNAVVPSSLSLEQEPGSRMLPLLFIQGSSPQMKMATHVSTTSVSQMKMATHVSATSVRSQTVPYTLRPTFLKTPSTVKQHFVIQPRQPSTISPTSSLNNRVFITPLITPGILKPFDNSQKLVLANQPFPSSNPESKLAGLLLPVSVNSSSGSFMNIANQNVLSDTKTTPQAGLNVVPPQSIPIIDSTANVGSMGITELDFPISDEYPTEEVVEMEITDEEPTLAGESSSKLDLNKFYQEAVEALFSPCPSPKTSEGRQNRNDLDDNVTVIRVTGEQEEPKKELPEDDVQIELVKSAITRDTSVAPEKGEVKAPAVEEVEIIQTIVKENFDVENLEVKSQNQKDEMVVEENVEVLASEIQSEVEISHSEAVTNEGNIEDTATDSHSVKNLVSEHKAASELPDVKDFDPMKVLDWKDGIGSLPGSDLKFCLNEFGMMEMVDHSSESKNTPELCEKVKKADLDPTAMNEKCIKSAKKTTTQSNIKTDRMVDISDQIYRCESCGVYGSASEFVKTRFCSHPCEKVGMKKRAQELKKQRDLLRLKTARRIKKAKQLELLRVQQEVQQQLPAVVSAPNSSHSEEDEGSPETNKTYKVPTWHTEKKGFSWTKYLEHCKAKGAPVKLFKDPFPYSKNGFKVGMKMEGIDPQHPSCYCVLTVSDVLGFRIRLHFDGYSDVHDFWVNADSLNIFPVGWCEKTGRQLNLPPGLDPSSFSWGVYLKECQAQAAPRHLFVHVTGSPVCPSVFRVGMKLEAVDRFNSFLVCVATVADIIDSRILIHLDGRDNAYDFWTDATSPYIHPVGWCKKNGQSLTPPLDWKPPQSFSWDQYLQETQSQAVPARAFKQRPPCGFRADMKLECVDKRVPSLIRVASVSEIYEHRIKVHFDGWPGVYSYWLDDDSPDIHPPGWCQKTGHPLEIPPMPEDKVETSAECPVPCCQGKGNINGQDHHSTLTECPYAPENLDKDGPVVDRLLESKKKSVDDSCPKRIPDGSLKRSVKVEKSRNIGRAPKQRFIPKEETDEEGNVPKQSEKPVKLPKSVGRSPKRKRVPANEEKIEEENKKLQTCCVKDQCECNRESPVQGRQWGINVEQLRHELHESIMRPGPLFMTERKTSLLWSKHTQNLYKYIDAMKTDVMEWTPRDVSRFARSIPGCGDKAAAFSREEIDGDSLLLMSQEDLINLGFRLGPAVKLYNCIVVMRVRQQENSHTC